MFLFYWRIAEIKGSAAQLLYAGESNVFVAFLRKQINDPTC